MKTLTEHNAEKSKKYWDNLMPQPRKNGIACPMCGEELFDEHPEKRVICTCGFCGLRCA